MTKSVAELLINSVKSYTVLIFVDFSHLCHESIDIKVMLVHKENVIMNIQGGT
jgi:hypothetical protein